jgi:hypothetical protein
MRLQKTRIQILLDGEDILYLHNFDRSGEKNASEVIHELIYDHKVMKESIEKFKKRLFDETQKAKVSYEEVRNKQIQKEIPAPDPVEDKWAWLRAKPEDPNLKNKVEIKKTTIADKEKEISRRQKKK